MAVLTFNLVVLVAFAIWTSLLNMSIKAKNKLFLFFSFFHLLFLHTFFEITLFPDLDNYFEYFNHIIGPNTRRASVELEPGWELLNKLIYIINGYNLFLLIVVSGVMIFLYVVSIQKYSAMAWLSVYILFCTVFYNSLFVLRQHLALPICLMTIPSILERKAGKFIFITLIAVSIHFSALVWLFAYIIYGAKLNIKFYMYLAGTFVIAFYAFDNILNSASLLTTNILAYRQVGGGGFVPFIKTFIVNGSVLFLCLFSHGMRLERITGHNKLFFQLVSASLFLNCFTYAGAGFLLFDRLTLYFSLTGMLLIPNSLVRIQKQKSLVYIMTPVICLCFYFYLRGLVQYGYHISFSLVR